MEIQKFNNIIKNLVFYVNTKLVTDCNVDPEWTLIYYLRNKLELCGTKLGCSEGNCGACTVMISKYDRQENKIIHFAANACLTPVCSVHGMSITTVEGIGSSKKKLHPVQERIAKAHGSQCGFCTPGIVMSMYALLRNNSKPTMSDLDIAFQGNLCRCTGYRPIIEGLRTFTGEWENSDDGNSYCSPSEICAMGDKCCQKAFTSEPTEMFNAKEFLPYEPSQEPIFPPKLQLTSDLDNQFLIFNINKVTWFRPITLNQLLLLKHQYPDGKIVVGNTEVGVEVKMKHFEYPVLIHPIQIQELREIKILNDSIKIGASVTLQEMETIFRQQIKTKQEAEIRILKSIVNMLQWFAGRQIRNVASIGGNIMTGSPISDLNPIFMAAEAKLLVCSHTRGYKTLVMNENFFTGYRKNLIAPDEILISIEIPFTTKDQYFTSYKQSKRRDDDITIVNMALNVFFKSNTSTVDKMILAYGGIAPVTVIAKKTCKKFIGEKWSDTVLPEVIDVLSKEFFISDDAPGGMVQYRRSLILSLFFKGFIRIMKSLKKSFPNNINIPSNVLSASDCFYYKTPKSSQYFQMVPTSQSSIDLIGRPAVHSSAIKQATGEAVYCDDIPKMANELYLSLILSTRTHAKILNIDYSAILNLENVVDYFDAKDIPEKRNFFGPIEKDEEIFASEKVICQGQIIGAIVATDQASALKAARSINIEYQDLQPVIITIEDAIKAKSFFNENGNKILRGDLKKNFNNSDHIIENEIRIGGQEHFYLETQSCIAIPKEDDEMEIFSSTQDPTGTQSLVSHILDIPANKISVKVKRLGGGFGGKESRSFLVSLPVAVAAHRLKKPVRCTLDRDEDMMITGTRHPFLFKYKVGFTNEGMLKALDIQVYANAGCSLDLSFPALQRAMFHVENAYNIPAIKVTGYLCKTNLPSNTAFRGFGGPQAMFAAETIIRHVADFLSKDVIKISEINLYNEGDITHYNQKLENCTIRRCWLECMDFSNYKERLKSVEEYNKKHRYRKKGITVIPTKFGIAFETLFLNQGAALVHVYSDGSVLLTHGGVEMGQGIHIKMIQIASKILKVNSNKIYIAETATDKVPNTTATAGSVGSDLNGMAVMDACQKIIKRIQYIIDANPKSNWEDWILKAYFDRVSLSATGFYKTPDIGYDFETNSGTLFNYFTYGAACSEVEIDCLTGDHKVLRTDIIMDLGESLNPAIDIGQIEGAFTQGYGLLTMEEMIYSQRGVVLSRGPGTYKIPGFGDIPLEFNVSLLRGTTNPRAVYSSKAVGEPPLFLAASIFFAIKDAIKAARKEMNFFGYFRLDSPATVARIRTACTDEFLNKVEKSDEKKSWNITP